LYASNCSGCHMPDLGGRNEAPQLAGTNFMTTWGSRSTQELLRTMQTTMPPGRPNSLTVADYQNIAAFVLASNGAAETALRFSADIPIRSVATGVVRTVTAAIPAKQPSVPERVGLTVTGEVKDFTPVSDDLLRHPNPGDWLMIRGNYQAWNF